MKTCTRCKTEKPLYEFNKRGNGVQSYCRECTREVSQIAYRDNYGKRREQQKAWKQNQREAFKEYKSNLFCVICEEDAPECLDFHHLNDNKDFDISNFVARRSLATLLDEIEKCVVLCRNCHAKVHSGRITI